MFKRILIFICTIALALSLCSCGTDSGTQSESPANNSKEETSAYLAWDVATDESSFSDLFSDKLFEYSDCMTSFAEHTEEFYSDVQNEKALTDNIAYSIIREKLLSWCYGVDNYPQESVFDSQKEMYNYYVELSTITHEFIDAMDSVSTVADMENETSSFISSASANLTLISQTAQPLYLVGKWLVEGQYIWEYKEDGTVIYPDGTIQHWRSKGVDEIEDKSIWKLEYQNTDNSQIYYEVVNGTDLTKLTVTPMQDGTTEVIKEVAYSGTYTVFSYELYTNANSTIENNNSTELREGEYWCMGKNDTCQNKTHSANDFFCDECDPDGDNVEG